MTFGGPFGEQSSGGAPAGWPAVAAAVATMSPMRFTPAATMVAGLASVTPRECWVMREMWMVRVIGRVDVTSGLVSLGLVLRLTLPVAVGDPWLATDCYGAGFATLGGTVVDVTGYRTGVGSEARALVSCPAIGISTSRTLHFDYAYEVK